MIELGSEVKDRVSGLKGTAIARNEWMFSLWYRWKSIKRRESA